MTDRRRRRPWRACALAVRGSTRCGPAGRQPPTGRCRGYAHGDLSAYNLLWWADELWLIDFPQAVDIAANPMGLGFLHRDVANITTWFGHQGLERDPDELFALLLGELTW